MAFRKTSGRSSFVQPTGIPDFSGFKAAASAYEDAANTAYNIGLEGRKREFNGLIRQAEIDGKTAGVTYDEQGNLVPLTNFDYAKASETYSENDQKQILRTYRKAAIQSYVNASVNDINDAATQSLIANPDDPEKIRSAGSGYLAGLQDLDEEIYTALAPKVDAAFKKVANQALAQQRDNSIKLAVAESEKALKANSTELAVLAAKGVDNVNPASAAGIQKRVNDILEEQEEIYDTLRANEVPESRIERLKDIQSTVISTRVAQASIERSFANNGEAQTYSMIQQIYRESQLNPDIDADQVRNAMVQSVTMMSQIQEAKTKEEKQVRASIFNDYRLSINAENLDIREEMSNPNSAFHDLDPGQQANLLLESGGRQSSIKNEEEARLEAFHKNNKVTYDNNMKVLQNPSESTLFEIGEAYREIEISAGLGQLGPESPGLLIEAKAEYRKAKSAFMQKGRDQTGSMIQMELGPMTSFVEPPSYYSDPAFINTLEQSTIIGDGGYWPNRKQYINDVESYSKRYAERQSNINLAKKADLKLRNGLMNDVTAKEMNAYISVTNFGKVNTGVQFEDMNLLSDDEGLFAASSNAVAGFAIQTGGLLHPEAKGLFDGAQQSVENATRASRVMSQVMDAIRKDMNIDQDQVEGIFYSQLGDETIAFMRTLNKFDPELAVEMFSPKNKQNQNRVGSILAADEKYAGESQEDALEDLFETSFKSALEGRSFFKFIDPFITDKDDQMLKTMAANAGVSNVEDMVINDPFIRDGMKRLFMSKMLQFGPNYNPVEAMRDTFAQIGTRLTPEFNPATNQLEFVSNSIVRQAQSTVTTGGLRIDMNDINRDIKDKFLTQNFSIGKDPKTGEDILKRIPGNPHGLDDDLIEDLKRINVEDTLYASERIASGPALMYVPNEVYGGVQTYSVQIRRSSGKMQELLPAYRYDFQQTQQYKSFQQAVETLKTDRMKAFWGNFPMMDPNLVQPTFDALERTRDDRSLNGLLKGYNFLFGNRGSHLRGKLEQQPFNPLNDEEVKEFYYMLERIGTLGWR